MATSMDTLPAHLLPLVMEEFPQSLATACVCRAGQREPRLRCVQCGIIEEEEEDCSSLEEDQAQRSFLQTVESLRRSTRWAPPRGSRGSDLDLDLTYLASPRSQSGDRQMSTVLWMRAALTVWVVIFWWKLSDAFHGEGRACTEPKNWKIRDGALLRTLKKTQAKKCVNCYAYFICYFKVNVLLLYCDFLQVVHEHFFSDCIV